MFFFLHSVHFHLTPMLVSLTSCLLVFFLWSTLGFVRLCKNQNLLNSQTVIPLWLSSICTTSIFSFLYNGFIALLLSLKLSYIYFLNDFSLLSYYLTKTLYKARAGSRTWNLQCGIYAFVIECFRNNNPRRYCLPWLCLLVLLMGTFKPGKEPQSGHPPSPVCW